MHTFSYELFLKFFDQISITGSLSDPMTDLFSRKP